MFDFDTGLVILLIAGGILMTISFGMTLHYSESNKMELSHVCEVVLNDFVSGSNDVDMNIVRGCVGNMLHAMDK